MQIPCIPKKGRHRTMAVVDCLLTLIFQKVVRRHV